MNVHDRSWANRSEDVAIPARGNENASGVSASQMPPFIIEYPDGRFDSFGHGTPQFKIAVHDDTSSRSLFGLDAYSAAMKFVRGEVSVQGDLVAAIRFYRSRPRSFFEGGVLAALATFGVGRVESWFQTKSRTAKNIQFHYDQSNEFYQQFLDPRMVYSCAYFEKPNQPLETAQLRKLEHICRKLDLQPGDSFLDVGCGWGGLVLHAAGEHGAHSTGCTLSQEQLRLGRERVSQRGLVNKVQIELKDYRDLEGSFDKIASVGMFEHVGQRRMKNYFSTLNRLLRPGGLVLNHGIMRPESARDNAETLFMRRKVFPGGEIPRLSLVIAAAEQAGFEVLDVENLRPHYAVTCRAWVEGLRENVTQCLRSVEPSVYRTWLLAFAASAVCFEDGLLNLNQLLLYKPGEAGNRPFTREYIYRP